LPRFGARLLVVALAAGTLSLGAAPAQAATPPVPPTPAGLTASIEARQTYVGQSTCDPVAKPGVVAFRDLLLKTYADSSSLGIVRDCGIGGQSEHKEGRAFDWGMSAFNPTQAAEVKALLGWLTKTDQYGNADAMLRRLGIMYMIWNKQIYRAYAPEKGWAAYTGESEHTDHVHFSFGWSGASKVTSYWDGTVAGNQTGPTAVPAPVDAAPFRTPDNIAVLRDFGDLTLTNGSTGPAVVKPCRPTARSAPPPGRRCSSSRSTRSARSISPGRPPGWSSAAGTSTPMPTPRCAPRSCSTEFRSRP
jgi:hypothetical protein